MLPLKILLIEDSEDYAEILQSTFPDTGFSADFKVIPTGEQALSYLASLETEEESEDSFGRPQLILVDLKLPDMSGLNIIQHISGSENLKHIPILVLTATSSHEARKLSYAEGATGFLVKETDLTALKEVIVNLYTHNRLG